MKRTENFQTLELFFRGLFKKFQTLELFFRKVPDVGTFFLALFFACSGSIFAQAAPDGLNLWARVNVAGPLSEIPLPIHAHLRDAEGSEYILTCSSFDNLAASGFPFEVIAEADPDSPLFLARSRRPANRADIPSSIRILHDDGHNLLILPGTAADRAALTRLGYHIRRLPDTPMIIPPPPPLTRRAISPAISSNAYVASMIANVHMTNLYALISELSGETPVMAGGIFTNIATRNTYETNSLDRALDYAHSHLRALGLDVQYHEWASYDYWGTRHVASRNIIAERAGTTTPSEIVILCAHIDSQPEGPLAPGADDNASGAIAVLTAARVMQHYTFDRTIRYVLFTGEEQGLLGSAPYATDIQEAGDNVVGVYNLDMISYDGNYDGKLNLHTRTTNTPGYDADFAIASTFTNVVRLYTLESELYPVIRADSEGYSDHAPFWQNGYPAILAIEDWLDDITPHYHTTNDVIGTLNFPYFTAFAQATIAAAAHSAGPLTEWTPVLQPGSTTNLHLSAGLTSTWYVTTVQGAFYAVVFSNATANIFSELSAAVNPGEVLSVTNNFTWQADALGTYRLAISSTSIMECALSLIALKMPEEADYSALNWTNAFIAAHETFSRQYAFSDWKTIDWGVLYSNTLPRIAAAQAATNEIEYYAALHEYVGSIPDGHVGLGGTNTSVPAAWGAQIAGGGYGLAVAELDGGRVIAAALLTNGPAQLAGMEPGAEIVSWNGLAPTSAIAQIHVAAYPLKALAGRLASSPQATLEHERLEQARLLVRAPVGTNVNVQFVNPGSLSTQTVSLTSTADTNATFALLDFAWMQDPSAAPVDYHIMSNGLGYLLIRFEANFSEPENLYVINSNVAEAVRLFVASNTPGVIVDVRGNLGGDDQLAATLCGYFYNTNVFYERQTWYNTLDNTFTELTFDSLNGWAPIDYMAIEPQSVYYGGPLAVLVNLGTVSSGEGVAMGIGTLPNARVIGFHGTHGAFGMAGGIIQLPGGYKIGYPYGQSLDENGVIQLDSKNGVGGVSPEIRIPMNASNVLAFAAGTDVPLNVASDYLLNQTELTAGHSATGTLAAGESAIFRLTISAPVWHGLHVAPTGLTLHVDAADLSIPGTYSLSLSNPSTSPAPYTLRLYNYTNAIAAISAYIADTMEEYAIPGMAVTLVDGSNVVMADGFGFANVAKQVPVTGDTIFNIGSLSKTFTAVAAMQLDGENLLDIDAPVNNYLPDLALRERFTNQPPMTARHMLAHLSGLPGDYMNGQDNLWPSASSDVTRVMAVITNDYPAMPTAFMPVYCNNGWEVLERLVEVCGGASFFEYAASNIFGRLDMTRSATRHNALELGTNIVVPYSEGEPQPYEYVSAEGAGGITSTARDMARFLMMLLGDGVGTNGLRVLSSEAVRAMYEPQMTNANLQFLSFLYTGLGWDSVRSDIFEFAGRYAVKAGDVSHEHAGLAVLPDAGLGLFLDMNSSGASQYDLVDQCLRYATLDKLGNYGPTNPLTPVFSPVTNWSNSALEALAGLYAGDNGVSLVIADTNSGTLSFAPNVQREDSHVLTGLVPRVSGWFSSPTSQVFQLRFTNVLDQMCLITRLVTPDRIYDTLVGQRFDPAVIPAAWSNRTGTWIPVNIAPGNYISARAIEIYDLRIHEGILYWHDTMALQPINDQLAFSPFYGFRTATALRADPLDEHFMHFGDLRLQRLDQQPVIELGAATNGVIVGDEIRWYRIPAVPGDLFIVDFQTDHHLQATLYPDGIAQGIASPAHAIQINGQAEQGVMLAVQRNGTQTGDFRLTIHTNAIPFYHPIAPSDWPAELTARSNLFPNTDFGYVYVKEIRSGSAGVPPAYFPVLKIAIARMKSPNPFPRPLLFLNGGPGDSGIRCAYQYFLKPFTDTHDIVLIDPRGVSYSQPSLDFFADEDLPEWQYRLTMLQQADLSALNTLESSYDVEDIATAFGMTEADLLGQSYGTLLAQTIMRREPAWLRSVILDGVVAPNIPGLSHAGPVRNEALENLFADVAAHPQASVWYPGFGLALHTLSTNLQNNPVDLIISGETNRMNGITFLNAVFDQLTSTDLAGRERIPNIVWRASRSETAALAELLTDFRKDTNLFMTSYKNQEQQILVIKHDFLPFDSLENASNACANLPPLVAQTAIGFMTDAIEGAALFDDYGCADNTFSNPVTVSIPTLVINGTYDTQTGTNWAAEVARHLPNAHLVVPPAVGHGVLFATNGCMTQIFRDFLADPTNRPDTSCLAGMILDFPPPWPANSPALSFGHPVTNTFDQPHSGTWYSLTTTNRTRLTLTWNANLPIGLFHLLDTHATILAESPASLNTLLPPATYYLWLIAENPGSITFLPLSRLISPPAFWPLLMEE